MNGNRRISAWRSPNPGLSHRPPFPRDIPPELARVIISYARVIVRMPPERAEVAVRAMESTVTEWRNSNGKQTP